MGFTVTQTSRHCIGLWSVILSFDILVPLLYTRTLTYCAWVKVTVLATACIAATLSPQFRHRRFRPYRAGMYAGLGLSAIVFIIHGLVLHGWEIQNKRMSLGWMGLMSAFNLIGAVAYATRVCRSTLYFQLCVLTGYRFRKDGIRGNTIYMVVVIRFSILWSFLLDWLICLACWVRLIICTARLVHVHREWSICCGEENFELLPDYQLRLEVANCRMVPLRVEVSVWV